MRKRKGHLTMTRMFRRRPIVSEVSLMRGRPPADGPRKQQAGSRESRCACDKMVPQTFM